VLLYLLGVGGEVLLLTSVYMVMPVGRLSLRHALILILLLPVLFQRLMPPLTKLVNARSAMKRENRSFLRSV
jgi:hypothetical protein